MHRGNGQSAAKRIALCGMMAGVSVVILLLGAALGLGIYIAPMAAGAFLLPIGRSCGMKYQLLLWLAVSGTAWILVPEIEINLMYFCLFGCYPILYPLLGKLRRGLRTAFKILFFNVVFLAVEWLLMWVLIPQTVDLWYLMVLLLLGNAMFFCYDRALPVMERLLERYLGRLLKRM